MLGRILGIALDGANGLNVAYLPDGLDAGIAHEMVETANRSLPVDAVSKAILIASGGIGMSTSESIRYRQGDRLAVVFGRHSDIGSFTHSFTEVIGPNYPDGKSSPLDFESLARIAADEFTIASLPEFSVKLASILADCFQRTQDVQFVLGQGTRGWNVLWYHHVDRALRSIDQLLNEAGDRLYGTQLEELCYAAFGFPTPSSAARAKRIHGTDIARAFEEYWDDVDNCVASSKHLSSQLGEDGQHHLLSEVDWAPLADHMVMEENQPLAFVAFAAASATFREALSATSDVEFTNPVGRGHDLMPWVSDANDNSLGVAPEAKGKNPNLVLLHDDDEAGMTSEVIRVILPSRHPVNEGALKASRLCVRILPANKFSWDGEIALHEDGIVIEGRLASRLNRAAYPGAPQRIRLRTAIDGDDTLSGLIQPSAEIELWAVAPWIGGVWTFEVKNDRLSPKGQFAGAEKVDLDALDRVVDTYVDPVTSKSTEALIVAWTDLPPARVESEPMSPLDGRPQVFSQRFRTSESLEITFGDQSTTLEFQDSRPIPRSPVLAAMARLPVRDAPLEVYEALTVRGAYENWIAAQIDIIRDAGEQNSGGLWSWALRSDKEQDHKSLDYGKEANFFVPADGLGWASAWPKYLRVNREFLESKELRNFRSAMRLILDFAYPEAGAGSGYRVPSTISWRGLYERKELLDRYLHAYADMVEAARKTKDRYTVFWASFPLSVTVWDNSGKYGCEAVLLSPLHPIRLAWLSSVEWIVHEADNPEDLAGSIEGWNFPYFGQRENSNSQFIAAPTEFGEDQLFLGWSMLLPASVSTAANLSSPEIAGGLRMPAGTASGLDSASVKSALRSFRKVNPHISTFTVDLAASAEGNRLESVDEVVIGEVASWLEDPQGPLFGGARVWDSMNRLGPVPRDEVARILDNGQGAPIAWARYRHDPHESKYSDVRILQDGGVQIFWDAGSEVLVKEAQGIVGDVPLRRFEVSCKESLQHFRSVSSPSLVSSTDLGWASFTRAVKSLETTMTGAVPAIVAEIEHGQLTNDRAEWTIAGESFMGPSDMAQLVAAQADGEKMMWEWRPPFLQHVSEDATLERRPFVSIARVPSHLRNQLETLLSQVFPGDDFTESVGDLMATLGAKGVGLSSMLSMGGTHVSGAIGFYLVFKLMEAFQESDPRTLVLPIDACDTFLRALGGSREQNHDDLRRADLLLIRATEEGLTFSPIEIKAYGLGSDEPNGLLPNESSNRLREPLGQLQNTLEVLDAVVDYRRLLESTPEAASSRVLWDNGLATLLDSALKLNPVPEAVANEARRSLKAVLTGKAKLKLGSPIIAYFLHGSMGPGGKPFVARYGEDTLGVLNESYALFAANPSRTMATIEGADVDPHCLQDAWNRLVTDALNIAGDGPQRADDQNDAAVSNRNDKFADHEIPRQDGPQHVLAVGGNQEVDPRSAAEKSKDSSSTEAPTPTLSRGDTPKHSDGYTPDRHQQAVERAAETNGWNQLEPFQTGDSVRFTVGRKLGTDAPADFWPSNTNLNQLNIGIVGDLGTGKTQMLKTLLYKLRRASTAVDQTAPSMLIFDYKRDFQENRFLEAVRGQVLHLHRIPVNFFDLGSLPYTPITANQKAGQFLDVLEKIYGGIGPKQRQKLTQTVTSLFAEGDGVAPLLSEILDRYSDGGEQIDSLTSIMSQFVNMEIFSSDREEIRTFHELMDDNVLVLAVNEMGTDDYAKNSLVTLFLNMYYQYMITSEKPRFFGDESKLRQLRSFLVVDEAVNIMQYNFPILMQLLLQGREFGFGVMLSSQYLRHFKQGSTNYAEPLLTWFIHKVPQTKPKDLEALGFAPSDASRFAEQVSLLPPHHSLYRSFGHPAAVIEDLPFFKLATSGTLIGLPQ